MKVVIQTFKEKKHNIGLGVFCRFATVCGLQQGQRMGMVENGERILYDPTLHPELQFKLI